MKLLDYKVISDFVVKHNRYAFAILLITGIFFMIAWGALKSPITFHVDEMWQYGYSNSYGKATKVVEENALGKWLPDYTFRDYITVQPDEKFSFSKILESSKYDIHPPLSHFLLNSVSSFFPNQFSKWFGLGINIIAYALTICLLYCLSNCLFASKSKALIATALWAFSLGAIDTVMYLRMYCLLTMFSVAVVLFSVKYMNGCGRKFLFLAYCSFILGGLTDYIFWIFGFYVTIAFVLMQWYRSPRMCVSYAAVAFFSFVTTCALFPLTIMQLINKDSVSNKATETFDVVTKLRLFFDTDYVIDRFILYSSEPVFFLPPSIVSAILSIIGVLAIVAVLVIFLVSVFSAAAPEFSNTGKNGFAGNPVAINEMVFRKINVIIPNTFAVFFKNVKEIVKFVQRFILSHSAAVFIAVAVSLSAYTLAAIFPDFRLWTVRAFFLIFPFFSIFVASILFLLHDKCKIPAIVLSLAICALLLRGYIVSTSPFLSRGGYEKLATKLEGKNVIIALDAETSIMRLPNFSTYLMGAKDVFILAVNSENYREEVLKALNTVDNASEIMVINLIGTPPANDVARLLLGPELLLGSDKTLVSKLAKNGYGIELENKGRHVFQWFNLYEISRY